MKNKILIKIFFCSLCIDLIFGVLLRGYCNLTISAVVLFILYFLFTNKVLNKYSREVKALHVFLIILLGRGLLDIPFRLFSYESMLISLPDTVFHFLGIIIGYLFYYSKRFLRIILMFFSLFSCTFLGLIGSDLWLHNLSYGTFTGEIKTEVLQEKEHVVFETMEESPLTLSSFTGKYLLVDFWHTYCGSCYREMPKVQELYDKYRENSNVEIYSLHLRDEEQNESFNTGKDILEDRGFSISCLSLSLEDELLQTLGIQVVPTVLIFDPENTLVFRGSIVNASNYLEKVL